LFFLFPGIGIVPGIVAGPKYLPGEFPAALLPELLAEKALQICSTLYYNINKPQEKVDFLKFRHIYQKLHGKNSSYGKKQPASLHL